MWFGLAIIYLYKLIEKFINFFGKISKKLNSIINSIDMFQNLLIYRIVSFILFIDIYISLVFIKVRKIKWKLLFNIFCLTCFVYQSMQMTAEYFKYRTVINVKKEIDLKNTSIGFPAISYCRSNVIEEEKWRKIPIKSYLNGYEFEYIFKQCKYNRSAVIDCYVT